MSLENQASIGETISGAGVLISLVFLILEIRNNTRALQAQTFHNLTQNSLGMLAQVYQDENLLDFVIRVVSGDSFESDADQLRRRTYLVAMFRHFDNTLTQRDSGVLSAEQWTVYETSIREWVKHAAIRKWVSENQGAFSQRFHIEFLRLAAEEAAKAEAAD